MNCLNIGCKNDIRSGYVNLDIVNNVGVDVVHDLNSYPYPFKDNFFDKIYANNILEHLDDTINPMNELHRILKVGGVLEVIVPHFSCAGAFEHPEHKRFFGYKTFDFFKNFRIVSKRLVFGKKFQVWNYLLEPLFNFIPIIWEHSFLRLFSAMEVSCVLKKITRCLNE